MRLNRWATAFVAALALAGCSPASTGTPGTVGATASGSGTPTSWDDAAVPSATAAIEPSALRGDVVPLEGVGAFTVPAGSAPVQVSAPEQGATALAYQLAGYDAHGLPTVRVTIYPGVKGSAYSNSWVHQKTMSAGDAVSEYRRVAVDWPGASEAALVTWNESVALQDGSTLQVQVEMLFADADGAEVRVMVTTPAGEMSGSVADEVLRSLNLG